MGQPEVLMTIVVFSIVQSILGMGLLVFGTPTLLLAGYSFIEALMLLLPASVAISFAQVASSQLPPKRFCLDFGLFCLPVLVVALSFVYLWQTKLPLELLIAGILFASVVVCFFPNAEARLAESQRRNYHVTLILMGLVHGLSNMGGSVLSILARSQSKCKRVVRSYVAFCYLAFGLIQILTLFAFGATSLSAYMFVSAALAVTVFLVTEKFIFGSLADCLFRRIINSFMFSYAILLTVNQLAL